MCVRYNPPPILFNATPPIMATKRMSDLTQQVLRPLSPECCPYSKSLSAWPRPPLRLRRRAQARARRGHRHCRRPCRRRQRQAEGRRAVGCRRGWRVTVAKALADGTAAAQAGVPRAGRRAAARRPRRHRRSGTVGGVGASGQLTSFAAPLCRRPLNSGRFKLLRSLMKIT